MPIIDLGGIPFSLSVCSPWATIADVCAPCNTYDFDPALLEDSLLVASDVLFNLTGRRWNGGCQDTVRPCVQYAHPDTRRSVRYTDWGRYLTHWGTVPGHRWSGCPCFSQVELGQVPLMDIIEVVVDGEILDAERYRIDDRRWLVYIPESDDALVQGWPCCTGTDDEDRFEVTFIGGTAPPIGGIRAAAIYGCELALACAGSDECRLPEAVSAVTRQGVTVTVNDPNVLVQNGLVGLRDVDMWVQSVLLGDKRRQATVVVPEFARQKVRRWNT